MLKGNLMAFFAQETSIRRGKRPMLSPTEKAKLVERREYDPLKFTLLLYALAGFPVEADLAKDLSDPEREAAWEEFETRVLCWYRRIVAAEVPPHFSGLIQQLVIPSWQEVRREMENLPGHEVLVGLLREKQPVPVHGNGKTVMVH